MKPQTAQEFVNELNQEEGYSIEECQQFISELEKDLAEAEAIPKEVNKDAAAVIKALANFDPNAPKNTAATFDYQTYLSTDDKAKQIITAYLQRKGFIITEDKETYGTDILASINGVEQGFEVEISSLDFNNENFQYENVSFLARKEKYRRKGEFNYIIISNNHQYALTAKSEDIFKDENKITKYAGAGRDGIDEFYQLPKNEVKFFKISLTK